NPYSYSCNDNDDDNDDDDKKEEKDNDDDKEEGKENNDDDKEEGKENNGVDKEEEKENNNDNFKELLLKSDHEQYINNWTVNIISVRNRSKKIHKIREKIYIVSIYFYLYMTTIFI